MNLEGVKLAGLRIVPVRLRGSWRDGPGADWRGTATATVPLVGMSFLESGGHGEWCKSERQEAGPEMRLALFPYDEVGTDVQVSFSVGHGGRRWRTLLPSPAYRPDLPVAQALHTAQFYRFATIKGIPPVNLFVLFVVRDDTESSRNTLWRVRPRLEAELVEPFRRWLTFGRTGKCEV